MRTTAIVLLLLATVPWSSIHADTPDDASWDLSLTVVAVYIGDYNMGEGRVYIQCSNGRMYGFNCGPKWTALAYGVAVEAFHSGGRIGVLRGKDHIPGEPSDYYWAYDVVNDSN
jgi:hypothetical protein